MAEPPDYQELARRYVELWQDQLSALAGDRELAEMLARLLAVLGAAAPWSDAVWRAPRRRADDAARRAGAGASPEPKAGAAPAAAAPPQRDDAVEQLARRIAALEERLAALEGGAREGGKGPRRARRGGRG